ncbi:MAG: cytochrome P450 [Acidimicrobiia bacterium]|nr:cytochrome P450 [Actinomycetota bacterium]MBL6924590.1 cytochrome P450 [Acidimicrobiia bacterium]
MTQTLSHTVDLADPGTYSSGIPHKVFRNLRAQPGLAWNDTGPYGSGFWSVTRLDDLVEVSRDTTTYSSELGHIQIYDIDDDVRADRASMIDLDPPVHTWLRRLVSSAFTPRHVQNYAPAIRKRVRGLLGDLAARGSADWASAIAMPIPIGVICDIMGVPESDHDLMIEMSDHLVEGTATAPLDPTAYGNTKPLRELPFNSPAAYGIEEYARRARADRLAKPRDDLLTRLAEASIDGEALSENEYARFFQLMIFAGNETTRSAMSHMATYLADHRDQFDRVRSDPSLVDTAVEEIVRHASPILYFRRTATIDTVLSGTPVTAGDKVVMWYASANFDENHFEDPYRFDVARPRVPANVAFGGGGAHFCLGASLARVELSILLEEFLASDMDVEVMGQPTLVESNFVNGVQRLDVSVNSRVAT